MRTPDVVARKLLPVFSGAFFARPRTKRERFRLLLNETSLLLKENAEGTLTQLPARYSGPDRPTWRLDRLLGPGGEASSSDLPENFACLWIEFVCVCVYV